MSPEPIHQRSSSARFAAALAALWMVACSAGVDGFHLPGSSGSGASHDNGDATGDGGNGNDSGGTGGASNGGHREIGGTGNGGTPLSDGGTSSGGKTVTTTGGDAGSGVDTGGASNGGASNGGKGNGGAGGSGGKGGTGGVTTGGVGNGGAGNGGMGTGGTPPIGPADPTPWRVNEPPTWSIDGAAWSGTSFFLLDSTAKMFWEVNPATHNVVGQPRALPNLTIYPHSFAASKQAIYFVGSGKGFRIPQSGWTSGMGTPMTFPTKLAPIGAASASDVYLSGDFASGKTAEALDVNGSLISGVGGALGKIYGVSSDGASFVFNTLDVNYLRVHRAKASDIKLSASPCTAGSFGTQSNQLSVHGSTVAWLLIEGSNSYVNFGTIDDSGVCKNPVAQTLLTAVMAAGGIGLVDDNYAFVVDRPTGGSGSIHLAARPGYAPKKVTQMLSMGANDVSIFVGASNAVFVSGGDPVFASF
jgi:hypothetical protein